MSPRHFLVLFALTAFASAASAAVVTTNADSGTGSLRDAIANASAGDTITFDPAGLAGGQTITLTGGQLAPSVNLTITGAGAPAVTIVNPTGRVFNFENATPTAVTLDNLTLQGAPTDGNTGGALRISVFSTMTLTLSNSTVSGALTVATRGGALAVSSAATLIVDHCTVSGTVTTTNPISNNAGGAIYAGGGTIRLVQSRVTGSVSGAQAGKNEGGAIAVYGGALVATDSTITGSSADVGGGVFLETGSASLTDTTVANNTAATSGGGIHVGKGTATLTNVTISGNSAATGGGVYADYYATNGTGGSATTTLTNSTIANNTATTASALYVGFRKPTTGINPTGSNVTTLKNTIVSGSVERQLSADVTDTNEQLHASHSLFDAAPSTGAGNTINGTNTANLFATDPQLGALQNNGGATQTQALSAASPALEGGDSATCPTTDQRGALRFGVCDIGAYEDQGDRLFADRFE